MSSLSDERRHPVNPVNPIRPAPRIFNEINIYGVRCSAIGRTLIRQGYVLGFSAITHSFSIFKSKCKNQNQRTANVI